MANDYRNRPDLPKGLRNNNPGNLRTGINWQGAVGNDGSFIIFKSMAWGLRAMATDLINKIKNDKLDTIQKIINKYAPANDNNDPVAYAKEVSQLTGIGVNDTLNPDADTIKALMKAQISVEIGPAFTPMVTDADMNEAFSLLSSPIQSFLEAAAVFAQSNPGTVAGTAVLIVAAIIAFFHYRKNK